MTSRLLFLHFVTLYAPLFLDTAKLRRDCVEKARVSGWNETYQYMGEEYGELLAWSFVKAFATDTVEAPECPARRDTDPAPPPPATPSIEVDHDPDTTPVPRG